MQCGLRHLFVPPHTAHPIPLLWQAAAHYVPAASTICTGCLSAPSQWRSSSVRAGVAHQPGAQLAGSWRQWDSVVGAARRVWAHHPTLTGAPHQPGLCTALAVGSLRVVHSGKDSVVSAVSPPPSPPNHPAYFVPVTVHLCTCCQAHFPGLSASVRAGVDQPGGCSW